MKLRIFSIFWLRFSSIVRASPDPITHTFLSLLKDAARKTTPSKNDFAIINQLKNLDLKQLSHKKGGNTRSSELDHQTSGPRPASPRHKWSRGRRNDFRFSRFLQCALWKAFSRTFEVKQQYKLLTVSYRIHSTILSHCCKANNLQNESVG